VRCTRFGEAIPPLLGWYYISFESQHILLPFFFGLKEKPEVSAELKRSSHFLGAQKFHCLKQKVKI